MGLTLSNDSANLRPLCGPLAQLVEHRTFNPLVVRSNRTRPTTIDLNELETVMDFDVSEHLNHIKTLDKRLNALRGYL